MTIKDFLFPKICLGCGLLGMYICPACEKKLHYIDKDRCLYCGRPSLFGLTHPVCERGRGIDGFLSIFYYNAFLQKIIKTIKYRLAIDVLEDLCNVIKPQTLLKLNFFRKIKKRLGLLYVQSIPLHPLRLRRRGFNQAQLLSEFFQKFLALPLSDVLLRKKATLSQAQLFKDRERFLNMRGAFELVRLKDITQKDFILVDDVLTTGATIKEAGRVLKLKGAGKVFALTLAKG